MLRLDASGEATHGAILLRGTAVNQVRMLQAFLQIAFCICNGQAGPAWLPSLLGSGSADAFCQRCSSSLLTCRTDAPAPSQPPMDQPSRQ